MNAAAVITQARAESGVPVAAFRCAATGGFVANGLCVIGTSGLAGQAVSLGRQPDLNSPFLAAVNCPG